LSRDALSWKNTASLLRRTRQARKTSRPGIKTARGLNRAVFLVEKASDPWAGGRDLVERPRTQLKNRAPMVSPTFSALKTCARSG
jgi:hypothetical protein